MKKLALLVTLLLLCLVCFAACFGGGGTSGLKYEYKSLQTGPLSGNFSGMYTVVGCSSKAKNVVIPEEYRGHSVYVIGENAFENNTYMETIVIPCGCYDIKANAFLGCTSLQKIYYGGYQRNFEQMSIAYGNDCLKNATWYFYSENKPQGDGNYWHFVNKKVVEW